MKVPQPFPYQGSKRHLAPAILGYMDPPYQGVCGERDPRYLKAVLFDEFVEVLEALNARDISYLVSYDGRTGEKVHGHRLPGSLGLHLVELEAGRSTQATLLGRVALTIESLYLSPALADRLRIRRQYWAFPDNYNHIAMRQLRRTDIMWAGPEVEIYEKLKQKTIQLQKNVPGYVKEIIEQHLRSQQTR